MKSAFKYPRRNPPSVFIRPVWPLVCAIVLVLTTTLSTSAGDTEGPAVSRKPADYRSPSFLIHTDLTKDDAEALLVKLETMLKIISQYWGAPNRRTIECFVVDDLKYWPDGSLPAEAVNAVRSGGVTLARGRRLGNQITMNAIVYASNRFGTPQHEAVHAYCYQTFGMTGPTWYAEGMAEMGNYWIENDPTVTAPDYVIRFLNRSPRKSLSDITNLQQQTGDGWQNYAWRWALCHFLANNRNYRDRFRPMGVGLLTGKRSSFAFTYDSQMRELEFEFQFFVDHLARGVDVGRTSWNWNARHRKYKGGTPISSTINADQGWQASGLEAEKGQTYQYSARGIWNTGDGTPGVSATGAQSGSGRLTGVLFNNYELSEPFALGRNGTFTADGDGQLWLRCRDNWNELSDNAGSVSVELHSVADGKP